MSKLTTNTTDLQAILDKVNALPEQKSVELQEKTVSPTTSAQTVTPDSGYDGLSQVTVNAIPSNYEDVAEETETYTDSLGELESVINSLPEAGGSSGGSASVETCTVVVTVTYPLYGASATCYENGEFIPIAISVSQGNQASTINNVVCGSCVTVADCIPSAMPGYTVENAELIQASYYGISGNSSYPVYPFKITAAAGETATITIYDND